LDQLSCARFELPFETFLEAVRAGAPETAPGIGGLTYEHIQALDFSPQLQNSDTISLTAKNALRHLWDFSNLILTSELPAYFYSQHYTAVRVVPINKKNPKSLRAGQSMEHRPIGIGNTVKRVIEKAIARHWAVDFKEAVGDFQFAIANKAGGTQMSFAVQAILDQRPDFVAVKIDIANAFNEISRTAILDSVWDDPKLRSLYMYVYLTHAPYGHIMMGGPALATRTAFRSEDGGPQGGPLTSVLFALAEKAPHAAANETLKAVDAAGLTYVDDNTTVGPPEVVFGEVLPKLEQDLAARGLTIRPDKSSCYIHKDYRDAHFEELRAAAGIPLDEVVLANGETAAGIIIYGIPHGEDAYITAFLDRKAQALQKEQQVFIDFLHPSKHDRAYPTGQALLQILLRCLRHQAGFYLRHIDPVLTGDFANTMDLSHQQLLSYITDIDITNLSDFTKARLELPLRLGGIGLTSLSHRRHVEHIGGFSQGCPPLLDRTEQVTTDDGTVSIVTRRGCLAIQPIIQLFGLGSFNHDNSKPWETLLSHTDSALASSLKNSWTALTTHTTTLNVNGTPSVFDRDVSAAGTDDNGALLLPSVTTKLGQAYDRLLHRHVETLPKTKQEELSFSQSDSMSWQFLLAAPNKLTTIPNRLLPELFAQLLGIPSPNFRGGGFIGKTNPTPVDCYGNNVAARGDLPGVGFKYIHDTVRDVVADLSRTAGFHTKIEVTNHLRECIPAAVQTLYDSSASAHCIRGDIRIANYPNNDQNVDQWTTASTQTMPALFEIKTIRMGTRYDHHGAHERATDKRGRAIIKEYRNNAYSIDKTLTPNDTRPTFNGPGTKGHFEQALDRHATGNVIPLVVGSFGETNKALDKLVSLFGTMAAKTPYGMRLSPHPLRSGRGADTILQQQFRRRIGVEIVCSYAFVKMERLQYVGSTADEARNLASGQHNRRWWNHDAEYPSFFRQSYNNTCFHAWQALRQSALSHM